MKKELAIIAACVLLVVGFCSPVGSLLLLGWIGFLGRTLRQVAADGPTVLAALVAVGLFTAGVHLVGRSWARRRNPDADWKWAWSAAVTATMFLLFAGGVAAVGLVNMVTWLATSAEPFEWSPYGMRPFAEQMKSSSNLKWNGLAFHNRHELNQSLPRAGTHDEAGRALHGWETNLLPFLEQDKLYRRIDQQRPWNDPANADCFRESIPSFLHPALTQKQDEHGFALNHYPTNSHVIRADRETTFEDISDGLGNTFLSGEINSGFRAWGRPLNVRDPGQGINRSPRGFGGPAGSGGANMLMADGSVRFVRETTSPAVLRALATPRGGEEATLDTEP